MSCNAFDVLFLCMCSSKWLPTFQRTLHAFTAAPICRACRATAPCSMFPLYTPTCVTNQQLQPAGKLAMLCIKQPQQILE
jgi:hypothetical protein